VWKHVLLLVLTICTTTFVGASYYASFASDFGRRAVSFNAALLLQGLWYSVPVLLILGAHEMGHYLCCRRYNVDASLPYFIPLPMFPTGTLGAVIKIREMFPTRTILFDIGVAGPIAGFLDDAHRNAFALHLLQCSFHERVGMNHPHGPHQANPFATGRGVGN